jgi:hypothetical protein
MYACILETGRGFFGGVCVPSNAIAHLHDPRPASQFAIRELALGRCSFPILSRDSSLVRSAFSNDSVPLAVLVDGMV